MKEITFKNNTPILQLLEGPFCLICFIYLLWRPLYGVFNGQPFLQACINMLTVYIIFIVLKNGVFSKYEALTSIKFEENKLIITNLFDNSKKEYEISKITDIRTDLFFSPFKEDPPIHWYLYFDYAGKRIEILCSYVKKDIDNIMVFLMGSIDNSRINIMENDKLKSTFLG